MSLILSPNPTLWTPANISTALWLDAADASTITTVSGAVSEWRDKSGNGRHFSQSTASLRPTLSPGPANGMNSILFSEDYLRANTFSAGSNVSLFFVVTPNNSNINGLFDSAHSSANPVRALSGAWEWWDNSPFVLVQVAGNTRVMLSFEHKLSPNRNISYYKNSVLEGSLASANSNQIAWREPTLGAVNSGNPGTPDPFFGGRASEVIIVNGEDRQRIEGYLAHKWGLTANLPSNHPYKTIPPYTIIYDSDAQTYITNVEAADGQALEAPVKAAYNDFFVGCKSDPSPVAGVSNFEALKASCIMAGARTLAGALVPLKGAAPTNFNFVAGDYNRKTGLVGDGSTKYLDPNRNNNADPRDSRHMSVWRSVAATNNGGLLGGSQLTGWTHLYTGFTSFIVRNADVVGYWSSALSAAPGPTFYGTSRNNSANYTIRVGSNNYSQSSTSQAIASSPLRVFENEGSGKTNARLSFYSIGEAIDLALLDARVTTLMNALAAAIP